MLFLSGYKGIGSSGTSTVRGPKNTTLGCHLLFAKPGAGILWWIGYPYKWNFSACQQSKDTQFIHARSLWTSDRCWKPATLSLWNTRYLQSKGPQRDHEASYQPFSISGPEWTAPDSWELSKRFLLDHKIMWNNIDPGFAAVVLLMFTFFLVC